MYVMPVNTIKHWAEEDRPREKLMLRGKHNLSDAELLAILLGSGSRDESAVSLAQRILKEANNNLQELGRRTIHDFQRFKGVGEAKAITIVAAIELSRRRELTAALERPKIIKSQDAYELIAPTLADLSHEEFWVLLMNRQSMLIHRQKISTGGVASTIADPRMVFRCAVEKLASSIVLCHNHPSGILHPSQSDIELTRKMIEAGKALEITIYDHIIISDRGFFSFSDNGLL